MPLLDHFHPPLSQVRRWESLHGHWTSELVYRLNAGALPKGYIAEMQVTLAGRRVEVDVAAEEEPFNKGAEARHSSSNGGVATLEAPVWAPPEPTLEFSAIFPDEVEVLVFSTEGGLTLVGAIELVSPGNKDRPEARRAFAIKCLSYLQQGIGVLVVDIVTTRLSNLHDEIARLLPDGTAPFPGSPSLYVVAYRPFRRANDERIAAWPGTLSLGQELPVMPLWLRGVPNPVRVDLETAYAEAKHRAAID